MRTHRWNRADIALLIAFVSFLIALFLSLLYPSYGTRLLLAAAEAATVGGIADYFAVTALFEKPFGFAYHTAILPRRRRAFIEASVTLVQREFLSKRNLLALLQHVQLLEMLLVWLERPAVVSSVVQNVLHYIQDILCRMDKKRTAADLVAMWRKDALQTEGHTVMAAVVGWLQRDGRDVRMLGDVARYLRKQVADEAFPRRLETFLDDYTKAHVTNRWSLLLLGVGHATDVVNFSDLAIGVQRETIAALDDLAMVQSEKQRAFLRLFWQKVDRLSKERATQTWIADFLSNLFEAVPLEETMERVFMILERHLLATHVREPLSAVPVLRAGLEVVLHDEVARLLSELKSDRKLRQELDAFLYDVAARSLLAAQEIVGTVVRDVLEKMSDAELNRLVYDKVEPDLLWIRMNGCLVGGGLGALLFIILEAMG